MQFRYVREWLALMACGGLIEVDASGGRFWMPAERANVLAGPQPSFLLAFSQFLPIFGTIYEDIVKVFQTDGPLGKLSVLNLDKNSEHRIVPLIHSLIRDRFYKIQ